MFRYLITKIIKEVVYKWNIFTSISDAENFVKQMPDYSKTEESKEGIVYVNNVGNQAHLSLSILKNNKIRQSYCRVLRFNLLNDIRNPEIRESCKKLYESEFAKKYDGLEGKFGVIEIVKEISKTVNKPGNSVLNPSEE